ncbi:hypothetical protein [Streptosporangium canum]|uniref:hypothetical protein n=1 Tax=Streptosporangium canum TaxID=324952 RepID=UPI00341D06E4
MTLIVTKVNGGTLLNLMYSLKTIGVAMTPQPRRIIKATYDAKVFYHRMLWDEFASGGMLARDDLNRNGLLFAYGIVRHVNGRTGVSKVGIAKLAQDLGYESENHGFNKAQRILLNLGFLTRIGSARRAAMLALSMPEALRGKLNEDGQPVYEDLMNCTTGDIVTVSDTSKTGSLASPPASPLESPDCVSVPPVGGDEYGSTPFGPGARTTRRRPVLS